MTGLLRDVVAVDLKTNKVRLMAHHKTLANAEAIVNLAVFRLGVESEFFVSVEEGSYKDGDAWKGAA